ncbi:glycosyltransferase [Synechococcales cyanobacterium C]|uniref:Glycosyltransferase n=1 Tax=Petrachloros mirabilis ULC683 TaxID=2781853 RepID=A0A8K1ZY32_9CYAN|nr:glycosyltransferase [Petrachloros mirabilis]NCJ06252.1 glycosyltransferase [Petrachloros mirabilis ULC683]
MVTHRPPDDFASAKSLFSEFDTSVAGLRVAIYSHDTMGLGHKRRNLLIAQSLVQAVPGCSVLLVTGMVEANAEDLPEGIDYLALPAWTKTVDGQYQARRLDLSLTELALLRGKIIRAAMETFNPDVFIVDNVPRGALRELDPVLKFLHRYRHTRCVLGLRDVLDEPSVVRRQWQQADNETAIRQYFDAIWVYGDPTVYDLVSAYRLPADIAAKVHYAGYLDARQRLVTSELAGVLTHTDQPLALCLVGGGQDGEALATAFTHTALPQGWRGILIAGPLMPKVVRQRLHQQVALCPNLSVLNYCPEPVRLIWQAQAVIAMGGYNTTCEVLSLGVRSLIAPRVKPRREQWIRAQQLQRLGLVDLLPPHRVCPEALTDWLRAVASQDKSELNPKAQELVNMRGLDRLPLLLTNLIAEKETQRLLEPYQRLIRVYEQARKAG